MRSRWVRENGGRGLLLAGPHRHSLSLALLLVFAGSFVGHLLGGVAAYSEEQALQSGAAPISAWQFLGTSDFWFQSVQNWQSELPAVGVLILSSIVLREAPSPESKPVTAAHAQTGAFSSSRRSRRQPAQAATGSRLAKQTLNGLSTYSP